MELVRVKIKATGKEAVLEKLENEGRVLYCCTSGRVFQADEVEELGPYECVQTEQQADDPLEQFPQKMVKMITKMADDYIDRFDRMYWQRQRVEIVKSLLNRQEADFANPIGIAELADKYIQILKNYD